MQTTSSTSTKSCRTQPLATVHLGTITVRCLLLADDGHFRTTWQEQDVLSSPSHRLMFLARDLFVNTPLAHNANRTHRKYAQEGTACKLIFPPDLVVTGLHNVGRGCPVWFYSVQAVFKLAFDVLGVEAQVACVKNLDTIWLSQVQRAALPEEVEVRPEEPVPLFVSPAPSRTNELTTLRIMSAVRQPDPARRGAAARVVKMYPVPYRQVTSTRCPRRHGCVVQSVTTSAVFRYHRVCAADHDTTDRLRRLVESTCTVPSDVARHTHGVLDVLERYCEAAVTADGLLPYENQHGVTPARHALLCGVAEWLGDECRRLQPAIEEVVGRFKAAHISAALVDDLPPAGDLVPRLFPLCMVVLLRQWMAVGTEGGSGTLSATQEQTSPEDEALEYNVLQLILEFANNSLISGVSHVVHMRLNERGFR